MSKWIHLGLAGLALGAATSMFLLVVAAGAEPLPGVEGVGVGGDHSCTVTVNSTVRCWGNNANGQLGDDSLIDRPSAVAARTASGDGIIGVKSVVSGRSHTCAVFVDGRLQCWGGNGSGQLGDGSTTARTTVVPVLDGADPIVDIDVAAAGAFHTCALLAAGQVRCWGGNFFGQLGDGSTNNSSEPRVVVEADGSPLTGVKGLAAGAFHTCALMDGGGVRCWGANFYGQRGDGTTTGSSLPIPVVTATGSALSNAKDLGAGANHTCAVLTSGRVNCWGDNSTGQLGNGESDGSTTPVLVELVGGAQLSAVGQVSAGGRHSCAVITSGALRCWGSNRYGQLGDGTVLDTNQAVEVLAADGSDQLDDVDHVSAGADHTCVLLDDERVTCWGKNDDGQIADRIVAQAATPVVVPYELAEVKSVSLGQAHTCVQMISNRSSCWGDNGDGQLGDQTNIDRTLPVAVRQVGGDGDLVNLKQLVVRAQLWVRPTTSCALTTTGRARCWGSNFFGQLGDGTTSNASVPVGVVGPDGSGELSGIRQLTVGAFHTCAVMTNGRVTCWGANFSGQLGDGSTTNRPVPVTVAGLDGGAELLGVIDAVGGGFHTCARTTPGQVRCWGSNFFGQLGDGTTDDARTPVRVRDDSGAEVAGIEQFSAGEFHVCGTQTDGPLRCWGGNFFGQLGDQSITDRPHPVAVQAVGGGGLLTGAVQVTAGGNHSCALLSDDRVTCWGGNGTGQLGDGTVIGRTTPTLVAGIDGIGDLGAVAHVTAGAHHTCVIHTDTRLTCWGDNGAGQLGDGTTVGVTMPIRVATDH